MQGHSGCFTQAGCSSGPGVVYRNEASQEPASRPISVRGERSEAASRQRAGRWISVSNNRVVTRRSSMHSSLVLLPALVLAAAGLSTDAAAAGLARGQKCGFVDGLSARILSHSKAAATSTVLLSFPPKFQGAGV